MLRWSTVLQGVFLTLSIILSFSKLVILVAGNGSNEEVTEADQWLADIGLKQYQPLFKQKEKEIGFDGYKSLGLKSSTAF